MPADLLAELADLPGVAEAGAEARRAMDALLWDRRARKAGEQLIRLSALRGGWANAAMDGAEVPFDAVLADRIEDSPIGERTRRAVVLTSRLAQLVDIYSRSPLQAWAQMNTVLVAGLAPESEVGRPRPDSDAEDPLRIGPIPMAMEAAQRMAALADLIVAPTSAPAIVSAGIVHAELAVLRPFRHASGPVARATVRLTLAARGLDPDLLSVPESGLLTLGRTAYVRELRKYASGQPQGMAAWLSWFSEAVGLGARHAGELIDHIR